MSDCAPKGRDYSRIPPITRCKLCAHFTWSDHFRGWFCALHHHIAEERGGCTWGSEKPDAGK